MKIVILDDYSNAFRGSSAFARLKDHEVVVYRDTVIISAEYDGKSFLAALARKDGKQVWYTPRPDNITFSSPVVAHLAGKDQLLLSGGDRVRSFDPANGRELWSTPGTTGTTPARTRPARRPRDCPGSC